MGYLITHIAISLVFADLLGLLLGWLIWGYAARQRSKEVMGLRERLADMQVMAARQVSMPEPRMALAEAPGFLSGSLIESELPARSSARTAFFEENQFDKNRFEENPLEENQDNVDETAELVEQPLAFSSSAAAAPILAPLPSSTSLATPVVPPISPDLEAEVRESKIQHLQQQVRDMEGFRDRVAMMQADLSDAIAGRKAAETRFQEAKNDFEVRSSGLVSQIKEFEEAAGEWEKSRDSVEREKLEHQRELSAVKATLRDLQNSQRPQAVDTTPAVSPVELADLRERYQRALRERDAVAAELEFWKQTEPRNTDAARLTSLEEAIHHKDAELAEQAARVERLLWRVAELEPFAAEAPEKEENLRRQESEIAGHMAVHTENGERIRALQNHISELQATTIPQEELQRILTEHQNELEHTRDLHEQRHKELQEALAMKDDEITEHVSVRYAQMAQVSQLQEQLSELDGARRRLNVLEQTLGERDAEVRRLLAAHSEMQHEMEGWRTRAEELELFSAKVPQLQSMLDEHASELQRWKDSHSDKEGQLTFLQERLSAMSSRLLAQQQRIAALEPLTVRAPELERQLDEAHRKLDGELKARDDRHTEEVTRLKANSAQRIRRLRQSITSFKG